MSTSYRFAEYMNYLAEGLGHADRRAGLESYCTGLMLPLSLSLSLSRKSVEPMASGHWRMYSTRNFSGL